MGIDFQALRGQFSRVLSRSETYLANHSLGRPPDATFENIERGAKLWAERMDEAWECDAWMGEIELFRSQISELVGAAGPKYVVPKVSAGQGLRAVLNALLAPEPIQVVTTSGEFDSIDFILKAYHQKGFANVEFVEPVHSLGDIPHYELAAVLDRVDSGTRLVVVSAVMFGTGQVLSHLKEFVLSAKRRGALVLVDAYHMAGVIDLDFQDLGADFLIGGCYKYLRGGPGACYLAIRPEVISEYKLQTLDTGWFAKSGTFDYARPETPMFKSEGDGWLESTPPVLTAYQANSGLQFTLRAGVGSLRAHSLQVQQAMRDALASAGFDVFHPEDPEQYGGFSLVRSEDPESDRLKFKAKGVNVDCRGRFLRFGPDVLTTPEEIESLREIKL